ncbi:L-2-hydroxyglutarate oxidase [Aliagarivorans taiwanensis]|uniref:L-2-hydroxyglutarate oxidase n=1 Tax=Aliagarivorans taiwanensis TaxID=561966 RepID=UPI000421795B|nr:L-2-hydroxyglutarate oxidase [Aliagarivorans taiwanensis]
MRQDVDFIVVGGGIVGLSTAWQLLQAYPGKRLVLLEKEAQLAQHQSGHNSGVIHAGVYYEPGSLKADFCKRGLKATIAFCDQHQIPYQQCGKLLVATDHQELDRMEQLFERCKQNQIACELWDAAKLAKAEPNITGLGAIKVFDTGIADYPAICQRMAELIRELGGEILLNQQVVGIKERRNDITVQCQEHALSCQFLVVCGGLQADRLCKLHGLPTEFQIIPYRGEYYQLPESRNQLIKHLIYPIPDPKLPFLGVHLTRMVDGSVTVGPNAVQGLSREGYRKLSINRSDLCEMLSFEGFWKTTRSHLSAGLREAKNSLFKPGYLQQVRKYCPSLTLRDLKPYPAGIRAQAVMRDGAMVHDFLFAESPRSLHVCNAPSPAATSAIPIGEYLCQKIAKKYAP